MPVDAVALLKAIRNNAPIKLLSLALAVAAWYGIRKATSFEALIKDVPLRVRVDEGWAVLDQSISDVDVQFSGSLMDLRNLNRDRIEVEVDLRGKSKSGSRILSLSRKNVRSPGGARATRVDPGDIRISLDRESDKQVPVKADILGTPPEGFEVERVVCTPATVTLRGPQRRLDEVELIKTESIDMEGRVRSFQLSKSIKSPAENWSARIDPSTALIEVSIVERSAQKTVHEVRVRALSLPGSQIAAKFNPGRISVVLEGAAAALDDVGAAKLLAFVDCSDLADGKAIDLPVRISPPPGVRVVTINPPLVNTLIEAPEREVSR